MNQCKRISDYLDRHGSITPMEAFEKLRITKLATRIGEMIRSGHDIDKVMETHKNADGDVTRYMRSYERRPF